MSFWVGVGNECHDLQKNVGPPFQNPHLLNHRKPPSDAIWQSHRNSCSPKRLTHGVSVSVCTCSIMWGSTFLHVKSDALQSFISKNPADTWPEGHKSCPLTRQCRAKRSSWIDDQPGSKLAGLGPGNRVWINLQHLFSKYVRYSSLKHLSAETVFTRVACYINIYIYIYIPAVY